MGFDFMCNPPPRGEKVGVVPEVRSTVCECLQCKYHAVGVMRCGSPNKFVVDASGHCSGSLEDRMVEDLKPMPYHIDEEVQNEMDRDRE